VHCNVEEKRAASHLDLASRLSLNQAMKKYPDISEIIKKKEEGRRELAALPFEEKIKMVFKLRERGKFIESGRRANSLKRPKMKSV
jgi:hypothetical protein